ncbi:NADAR family protein [Gordonia sp. (in: high G+C Gram-positive bacteria)]|uniref:NADAR family protein n=1 Tax=Gordonia sp. (in: high G+C Gram-positive bacteria) TaxID=84139 RepID=UPI003C724B15
MTDAITKFRGDYFFLSNFFRCEFEVPGLGYVRSAEHAYQALKTDALEARAEILLADSPHDTKRVGREAPLRADWEFGGRVAAMQSVLAAKFSSPDLATRLSATGLVQLVEGNEHHDNFWGDCVCGSPDCVDRGANMLGELLMVIRTTATWSGDMALW